MLGLYLFKGWQS